MNCVRLGNGRAEDSAAGGKSCSQSLLPPVPGSSPPALHALGTVGRKVSLSLFMTPVHNQGRCFSSNFRQSYAGQACSCLTVNSISQRCLRNHRTALPAVISGGMPDKPVSRCPPRSHFELYGQSGWFFIQVCR